MMTKKEGEPVMIERVKDGKSKKGFSYQNYETYHLTGADTEKFDKHEQV